jgi:uncharacterized protein (TIGR03435 family)
LPEVKRNVSSLIRNRRLSLAASAHIAFAAAFLPALAVPLRAQSPQPDWEKAAGGKQSFDVASVRENNSGGAHSSNVNLDGSGNAYWVMAKSDIPAANSDLFSATNQPLIRYIIFAYRLNGTQELALRFDYYKGLGLQVPGWVKNTSYDIEARSPGPATKDQMRLMMQSLLVDRFKLAVHWETRQAPVLALVPEKPGKLGPQIEPHPAGDDCAKAELPDKAANTASSAPALSSLPIPCGWIAHLPPGAPGAHRFGGRNVTLAMLGTSLPAQTGLVVVPRPVIDRSGLAGGFDFWMEWTPEDTSEVNNSETGGTFLDALKNQLGLKLVPQDGPVEVLVIDHAEQPTPN